MQKKAQICKRKERKLLFRGKWVIKMIRDPMRRKGKNNNKKSEKKENGKQL